MPVSADRVDEEAQGDIIALLVALRLIARGISENEEKCIVT